MVCLLRHVHKFVLPNPLLVSYLKASKLLAFGGSFFANLSIISSDMEAFASGLQNIREQRIVGRSYLRLFAVVVQL